MKSIPFIVVLILMLSCQSTVIKDKYPEAHNAAKSFIETKIVETEVTGKITDIKFTSSNHIIKSNYNNEGNKGSSDETIEFELELSGDKGDLDGEISLNKVNGDWEVKNFSTTHEGCFF